jgi:hypothetical protein
MQAEELFERRKSDKRRKQFGILNSKSTQRILLCTCWASSALNLPDYHLPMFIITEETGPINTGVAGYGCCGLLIMKSSSLLHACLGFQTNGVRFIITGDWAQDNLTIKIPYQSQTANGVGLQWIL